MERGFAIISEYTNQNINLPVRKTAYSAGYDFEAAKTIEIEPSQTVLIPTGIKAFMGNDEVLKLYIRSSLAYKKQLILTNSVGIIDADYYNNDDNEGHIMVLVTNISSKKVTITKGERIAQGIFEKYLTINEETDLPVREGGFGSTGA